MQHMTTVHDLAERLRDATLPILAGYREDVDDFLFVGEEGLAIEFALRAAIDSAYPLPAALRDELAEVIGTFPDRASSRILPFLHRVPIAA